MGAIYWDFEFPEHNMRTAWKVFPLILIGLAYGCGSSDRGHHGTPSDPNEQQGNPNAKPEESTKPVTNGEPATNKASKDPHTLTPDNTAGQPKKR